ncbi:hypothetical protein [Brucella pecoris]|uniref:Uncharacterized protein n=1 Tax=Brucella pecoris TaxID=867683 RepID=A0A5C5CK27_9HYPH|nr:hypothetical protein [Brucella pecoris]MBB4091535.1 hypothetical protein [Brucella pecoris]TNV11628.1 hypothetical protein FIB18_12480 [Brucella pecoris]
MASREKGWDDDKRISIENRGLSNSRVQTESQSKDRKNCQNITHNLKAAGSNPAPATKSTRLKAGFFWTKAKTSAKDSAKADFRPPPQTLKRRNESVKVTPWKLIERISVYL